jgi:predicted nucleic acid-binding protein
LAGKVARGSLQGVAFDTDVLIWYLRGSARARRFLTAQSYSKRAIPSVTVMELIQGCRNSHEIRQLRAFVDENFAAVLYPNEAVCRAATDLLEEHAPLRGLRVVDALIAATALEASCSLATANVRHYRFIPRLHLLPFRPETR